MIVVTEQFFYIQKQHERTDMQDQPKSPVFVNTQVDDETHDMLSQMLREDNDRAKLNGIEISRSAFMRMLIRQEYARRYSRPNPLITIADAQSAAALRAPEGEPQPAATAAGDALRAPVGE